MISTKLLRCVDVFIGIRRLLWLDVAAAETHLLRISCYWRIMRCPDSGGALWWRRRRWAVARICSKNRVQSRHPKIYSPKEPAESRETPRHKLVVYRVLFLKKTSQVCRRLLSCFTVSPLVAFYF